MTDGGTAEVDSLRAVLDGWRGELLAEMRRNTLLSVGSAAPLLDLAEDQIAGAVLALIRGVEATVPELVGGDPERATAVQAAGRQAKVSALEVGVDPLHLGLGLVTTGDGAAIKLDAPLLLFPVRYVDHGRWRPGSLEPSGSPRVNPALLALFQTSAPVPDLAQLTSASDLLALAGALAADVIPQQILAASDVRAMAALTSFTMPRLATVAEFERTPSVYRASPLVLALAGDETGRQDVIAAGRADATTQINGLRDLPVVLDADSTQLTAIAAGLDGRHLVVEGPPGTGKSQTIANLLVALSAGGKRVLFVTEKRPAVEAVLRRLAPLGLSDLFLDLHSTKETAGSVAGLVADRIDRAARRNPDPSQPDLIQTELTEFEELYRRFHRRDAQLGTTPFALQLDLAGTESVLGTPDALAALRERTGPGAATATLALRSAAEQAICRVEDLAPPLEAGPCPVFGHLVQTNALATRERIEQADQVVGPLGQAIAGARRAAEHLAEVLGRPAGATLDTWRALSEESTGWSATMARWEAGTFSDDALVSSCRIYAGSTVERFGRSLLQPAGRQLVGQLRARHMGRPGRSELLADAADAVAVLDAVGRPWPAEAHDASAALVAALQQVRQAGAKGGGVIPVRDLATMDASLVIHELGTFARRPALLTQIQELGRAWSVLDEAGLAEVAPALVEAAGADHEFLRRGVRYLIASARVDRGTDEVSAVRRFDRDTFALRSRQVAGGYPSHLRTMQANARRAIEARSRLVSRRAVDLQSLEALVRDRLSDLGVRHLFDQFADLVLEAAPCVVVAPDQVPELLPARTLFDVVVFDEASQVRPRDAVPALARATTCIVVGDSRQLPPTAFFVAGDASGSRDHLPGASELESLLDAVASLLPLDRRHTLGWHYRSRDPRLIAFSNESPDLYRGSLAVLPSRVLQPDALRHIEVEPSTAPRAAAAAVLERAAAHPEQTLMAVAANVEIARAIDREVRAQLRDHPELDAFFSPDRPEPFVVKNIERAQGDERDGVVLCITGPRTGSGALSHNFGAIGQTGGERRLNVAITRARSSLWVVTDFRTDEMDDQRLSSVGGRMLARYLRWLDLNTDPGLDTVPTGDALVERLRGPLKDLDLALEVAAPAGRHPVSFFVGRPEGPMVLAVDHNRADLADLDGIDLAVLRPELLSQRGWVPTTVWSTDLLMDPGAVARHLAALVEDAAPPQASRAAQRRAHAAPAGQPTGDPTAPYVPDPSDLAAADPSEDATPQQEAAEASVARVVAADFPMQIGDRIQGAAGSTSPAEPAPGDLRWSDPIRFTIGLAHGPSDGPNLVFDALRRVGQRTGHVFEFAGWSDDPPPIDASLVDLRQPCAWWIGWRSAESGVVEPIHAQPAWWDPPSAPCRQGLVAVIEIPWSVEDVGPRAAAVAFRNLLHEFGHVLGLEHGSQDDGVMASVVGPRVPTDFSGEEAIALERCRPARWYPDIPS